MTTLNDLNGYLDDEAYTVRVGELRALLSASIADTAGAKAEGWKLVPIEPTEAMVRAACLKQSNAKFESYEAWHDSHSSGISARIRQLVASDYRVMIDATPPAPSVADWKLVPVTPTLEMQYAAIDTGCCTRPTDAYAAMLAAAPEVIADTAGAITEGWMLVPKHRGTVPLKDLIIAASLACIENTLMDDDDRRELAQYADQLQHAAPPAPSVADAAVVFYGGQSTAPCVSFDEGAPSVADAKSRSLGKWTITKPKMDGSGGYETYITHYAKEARDAGIAGWGVAEHFELVPPSDADFRKEVAKLIFLLRTTPEKFDDETLMQLDSVEYGLECARNAVDLKDAEIAALRAIPAAGASEGQAPVAEVHLVRLYETGPLFHISLLPGAKVTNGDMLYDHPSAAALRERVAGIRMEALKEARHVVYMALSLNDAFNAIEALVDKELKQ